MMGLKSSSTVMTGVVFTAAMSPSDATGQTIAVERDVMTSAFFQGADQVRGYAGDNRPTFRVSSDNAFGAGPETVYLGFDASDFASFTEPLTSALLSVESIAGGFGADASADSPFVVSAHGVNADPVSSITDDTNPSGTISASDFFANNILAADATALTTVDGFGTVVFDITSIVNDFIDGTNMFFTVALAGSNDVQIGDGFLHGFANNTEAPGASFITVAVPEPASIALLGIGGVLIGLRRRA